MEPFYCLVSAIAYSATKQRISIRLNDKLCHCGAIMICAFWEIFEKGSVIVRYH